MARPSTYTHELAERICAQISEGKLMREVCAGRGMPAVRTVFEWLAAHPEFAQSYTRAKELQADAIAADTLQIADQVREGRKTEEKHVAWSCSLCGQEVRWRGKGWVHIVESTAICADAKADKVIETKVVTGDMVERARLQVDARKWLLAKIAPRKYGEKLDVDITSGGQSWAEVLRERRAKRAAESVPRET